MRDINSALIRTLPGLSCIQGTYEILSCRAGELWAGDFYLFSSSFIVCQCYSFSFLSYTLKIRREYRRTGSEIKSGVALWGTQASSSGLFYCKWGNHLVTTHGCCKNGIICFFLLSFLSFSLFCYTSIWFRVMCFWVTCIGWLLITGLQMSQSCWEKPRAETHLSPSAVSSQKQPRFGGRELPRGKENKRIAQKLRTNTGWHENRRWRLRLYTNWTNEGMRCRWRDAGNRADEIRPGGGTRHTMILLKLIHLPHH